MRVLLGLLLALAPSQGWTYEGDYRARVADERHSVSIRRIEGSTYRVDVFVSRPTGCAGYVTGSVRITGSSALLRVENEHRTVDDPRYCEIRLNFRGRTLRVEQGLGCTEWQGAACDFNATLRRR